MAASPQYIEGRGAADKKGARLRRGLCRKVVFQGATGFWPEDGGIAFGHAFGVRVDGPLGRRFLGFLGLTALWAEGGGIALSGDEF